MAYVMSLLSLFFVIKIEYYKKKKKIIKKAQ